LKPKDAQQNSTETNKKKLHELNICINTTLVNRTNVVAKTNSAFSCSKTSTIYDVNILWRTQRRLKFESGSKKVNINIVALIYNAKMIFQVKKKRYMFVLATTLVQYMPTI
jgi:hypothetical protein